MVKYQFVLLIFLGPFCDVEAQDTGKILQAHFSQVRAGKYQAIHKDIYLPAQAEATLSALEPYLADTVAVVRQHAYAIVHVVGINARQTQVLQKAVLKLINGIKDPDTGNAGQVLGYLKAFNIAAFNTAAKDTLVNIFKRKSPHFDQLIKLLGYLQTTEVRDDLRALAQSGATPRNERWASLLALARMGDTYAIEDIIARVRRFPVNDDVVHQIFPDLVYTRQRAVFDILIQALNSTEKNCESANPESSAKISCGYRIMEMLAPAIQDYPYEADESGDIITEDYEEALTTIREWFRNNGQYTLSTNSY